MWFWWVRVPCDALSRLDAVTLLSERNVYRRIVGNFGSVVALYDHGHVQFINDTFLEGVCNTV